MLLELVGSLMRRGIGGFAGFAHVGVLHGMGKVILDCLIDLLLNVEHDRCVQFCLWGTWLGSAGQPRIMHGEWVLSGLERFECAVACNDRRWRDFSRGLVRGWCYQDAAMCQIDCG